MGDAENKVKEDRVRALTRVYYSRPEIQKALLEFAKDRELVPRYFEGFGKRPDMLQYPSDIMGLVQKGATSFHGSEEHWIDPLALSVDLTPTQLAGMRKGWDLLIDIDSKYLELSQIVAQVLIHFLEQQGIHHYGIKFSGSKGFHIIVPWKAFPPQYDGQETRLMFPEWPKIIVEYLFAQVLPEYKKQVSQQMMLPRKEGAGHYVCLQCHKKAVQGTLITLRCPVCRTDITRLNYDPGQKRLRCISKMGSKPCPGVLEIDADHKTAYWYCETCTDPAFPTRPLTSLKHPTLITLQREEYVEDEGGFDLVLVASRHLFRAPYSLHEKTALASCVLTKEELGTFSPHDAKPLAVMPRPYIPDCSPGEGERLLARALAWKKEQQGQASPVKRELSNQDRIALTGVTEAMFPPTILKLLGMKMEDGKKRGLFVLITFLRACGFGEAYITEKVTTWNAQHPSPLRQAYLKGQLDWHFKQKKLILPPNYENVSFYRDLGILVGKPTVKNPLVEVQSALRR